MRHLQRCLTAKAIQKHNPTLSGGKTRYSPVTYAQPPLKPTPASAGRTPDPRRRGCMKPFALRVLVVRYVIPLDEILGRKTDKLARIIPQPSQQPVTLQELKQLVRPLQSLLPPTNAIEPTLPTATDVIAKAEAPTKTNKTKARQPKRSKNKTPKTERSPKKK